MPKAFSTRLRLTKTQNLSDHAAECMHSKVELSLMLSSPPIEGKSSMFSNPFQGGDFQQAVSSATTTRLQFAAHESPTVETARLSQACVEVV